MAKANENVWNVNKIRRPNVGKSDLPWGVAFSGMTSGLVVIGSPLFFFLLHRVKTVYYSLPKGLVLFFSITAPMTRGKK
jgi:hypothetical protein